MVGQGAVLECLDHAEVASVLIVGRRPSGIQHKKLREVIHDDFLDYSGIEDTLRGYDACFYCLGISSVGMSEQDYHRVTYDFTLRAAETLVRLNPEMTFCFVSGAGTDSTERGRSMWARVKGKTENHLMRLPFKAAFMFRPGYIQPLKGIKSRTRLYRWIYMVLGPLYPVLKTFFPHFGTTTQNIGLAMIRVATSGHNQSVLGNKDIDAVASSS